MQSATQAAEEAVRAVLGSDAADEIGIRWAQDKIVGIFHNGRPLGEREWGACAAVDLPVVDWFGSPVTAWLISVGKAFRCSKCHVVVSSERGADDNMPEACDACWNIAHKPETLIPLAVAKRLAKAAEQACEMNRGACLDDIVRRTAEILGFDLAFSASCKCCGESLLEDWSCPRSPGFRGAEEQHGATLAAHCGTRPWDELSSISRALWVERAKRLRKRWIADEPIDAEGNVALRKELFGEPEWSDALLTVQGAAASCIARLRRQRKEIALAASKLVAAWEQHGLSGLASHVYDLRAALEKYGK